MHGDALRHCLFLFGLCIMYSVVLPSLSFSVLLLLKRLSSAAFTSNWSVFLFCQPVLHKRLFAVERGCFRRASSAASRANCTVVNNRCFSCKSFSLTAFLERKSHLSPRSKSVGHVANSWRTASSTLRVSSRRWWLPGSL